MGNLKPVKIFISLLQFPHTHTHTYVHVFVNKRTQTTLTYVLIQGNYGSMESLFTNSAEKAIKCTVVCLN